MAQDYYADAAPPAADSPPAQSEAPETKETEKEEPGDSQTAEIPKAALGGKDFKPGEEVMFEVVQVMEDSVLVKYASEKGGGEEAPAKEEPASGSPGGYYG